MHDPKCVAHEIRSPFKRNRDYGNPILTIWHNDPETDGTDDSCGWFIRARHVDKNILDKIIKEFESEWDSTYTNGSGYVYSTGWFRKNGEPNLSVQAIVLNMYLYAYKIHFSKGDLSQPRKAWDKAWKFLNKNLPEIMYFAENNRDSMSDSITRKFEIGTETPYTESNRIEWIRHCASIVYTDILRRERKWWQHPRWHVHHWSFQFHPIQGLKRRFWDKCSICGKRGFKGSAHSDWNGTKIWHSECDQNTNKAPIARNH